MSFALPDYNVTGDLNAFRDLVIPKDAGLSCPLVYLRCWSRRDRPKQLKRHVEFLLVGAWEKLFGMRDTDDGNMLREYDLSVFRKAAEAVLHEAYGRARNAFVPSPDVAGGGFLNFYCENHELESSNNGEGQQHVFRFRYVGFCDGPSARRQKRRHKTST